MTRDMYRLLDQAEVWVSQDATEPRRLTDLHPNHRRNLLAWLQRRAERLKFGYELRMLTGPQPSGDMACDAFENAMDELGDTPALVWLAEQPLVIELTRLVARDRRRALRAMTGVIPAGATARLDRTVQPA